MEDKERIVEKVRKLIALASSPHEEEARSSAYKAAALIREFQLDVVDPVRRQQSGDWREIVSRYAGRCKTCHQPFDVGDLVFWRPGTGCIHEYCPEPRTGGVS